MNYTHTYTHTHNLEIDCDEKNVPFMTLRVDEHTGESHVQTRLEAFIDMLKIAKTKEVKV